MISFSLFILTLLYPLANHALKILSSNEVYLTDCEQSGYLLDRKGILLRESDGEVIVGNQCDAVNLQFSRENAVQVCNRDGIDLTNIICNWGGVSATDIKSWRQRTD